MRIIWKILLIVSMVLLTFPRVALAEASIGYGVFYDEAFNKVIIPVYGEASIEAIDYIIVKLMNNDDYLDFLQGEVKISIYSFEKGHLIVNFSKEVLALGGSSNEYYMTETILESLLSVTGVKSVTFYIEDKLIPFCEGTVIFMEEIKA